MRNTRAWFVAVLAGALLVRLALSVLLPVTGDEAYFYRWGAQPALGYWDHPPMVGWWIAGMLNVSHAPWAIRLPSTLLLAFVAFAVLALARRAGEDRAYLAATAVVLAPPELINVLITTDTPLVFFSLLSVLAYSRALQHNAAGWYVLAGALLGLAALSKYFAALLGFAYLVFALASPRHEHRTRGLIITYLCALPFVAFNLAWNWQHCWANIMFNFVVRHDDAGVRWDRPLLYVLSVLYATSVVGLIQLAGARGWMRQLFEVPRTRLLLVCGIVPLVIFALLSSFKTIGLHWLFSFAPLLFAAAAFVLTREQLVRNAMFLAAFSALHLLILAVSSWLPIETWARLKAYDGIVMTVRAPAVVDVLRQFEPEFIIAAEGYSPAATLAYSLGRHVPVYGLGSSHARHDDMLSDMRALAGKNLAIYRRTPPPPHEYAPYFDQIDSRTFQLHGATYYVVLGRGLRYEPYREQVLGTVRDRYYRIPALLPQGHCYYCERYFDAPQCPVRGG